MSAKGQSGVTRKFLHEGRSGNLTTESQDAEIEPVGPPKSLEVGFDISRSP